MMNRRRVATITAISLVLLIGVVLAALPLEMRFRPEPVRAKYSSPPPMGASSGRRCARTGSAFTWRAGTANTRYFFETTPHSVLYESTART